MLLLEGQGDAFLASSLGKCGFSHCNGARKANEAAALMVALEAAGGAAPALNKMHLDQPEKPKGTVWFAGDGFWLTTENPGA